MSPLPTHASIAFVAQTPIRSEILDMNFFIDEETQTVLVTANGDIPEAPKEFRRPFECLRKLNARKEPDGMPRSEEQTNRFIGVAKSVINRLTSRNDRTSRKANTVDRETLDDDLKDPRWFQSSRERNTPKYISKDQSSQLSPLRPRHTRTTSPRPRRMTKGGLCRMTGSGALGAQKHELRSLRG